MAAGFVDVLLNPSFSELVKIGRTTDASEIRARKLWSTGVPKPFIVVYDVPVSDCEEVERRVHNHLAGYRVHSAREFFFVPVLEAIRVLQEESRRFPITEPTLSNRVEILAALQSKYAHNIGRNRPT